MKTMIKMLAVLFCMNIFMYLGVNFSISAEGGRELNKDYNFHFEGDIMDTFLSGNQDMDDIVQSTKDNWTDYGVGLNANFTSFPSQQSGISVGAGGVSFLDALSIGWDLIKAVANIMTAPLTLFFNFRMPVFIGIMIGLPYFFILILTLIALLRGVGD